MNKRGQGLSVNVIIVAVIALVVLVVLVAIFTGRLGIFSRGVSETASCNQICMARGHEAGGYPEGEETGEEADLLLGARDGENRQCYCIKSP